MTSLSASDGHRKERCRYEHWNTDDPRPGKHTEDVRAGSAQRGPYVSLTGYIADGWGFASEDIDAAYADWLDKQAESIEDDNGFGPVHRWFSWHPVWTNTGWKWLRTLTRQRRWRTYLHDPSFGNGGPEETLIDWYWHHE